MSRHQGDKSPSRKVVPRCFLRTIPNLNLQMRPSLLRCPPPKRLNLATQPDHSPARVAPEATASGLGDVRRRVTGTKLIPPPLALSR